MSKRYMIEQWTWGSSDGIIAKYDNIIDAVKHMHDVIEEENHHKLFLVEDFNYTEIKNWIDVAQEQAFDSNIKGFSLSTCPRASS